MNELNLDDPPQINICEKLNRNEQFCNILLEYSDGCLAEITRDCTVTRNPYGDVAIRSTSGSLDYGYTDIDSTINHLNQWGKIRSDN